MRSETLFKNDADRDAAGSLSSPPLGQPPLADEPGGAELGSAPAQGQPPHPGIGSAPKGQAHGIPMTDGTPLPCRQKNAEEYLRGNSQGVMAQYGGGMFGMQQHIHSAQPAPDEAEQAVRGLAEWREQAPYG